VSAIETVSAPTDQRPGLRPVRLARLVDEAVARCALDLNGAVVVTEAATGSYAVTPVLAARAGASKVYALTRSTRNESRSSRNGRGTSSNPPISSPTAGMSVRSTRS
jgi:hypothetical protein